MGIKTWIEKRMMGGRVEEVGVQEFMDMAGEVYIRELAFWSCVNLIANAVSKCEFKTYVRGQEVKGGEYYLWNYEPNKNQNSSAFIMKWISTLMRRNEALIIEQNGQLLVADSFLRKEYALYENTYTQVTVKDFVFSKTFTESQVLYFKLSERDMWGVTVALYNSYQKMIEYAMKSYKKSRGKRGILNVQTRAYNLDKERYRKLINEDFRTFFEAENAIMPLFDGYEYSELGAKTYNNDSTRDIRAMINDVCEFTAKGYGIPAALVNGTAGTAEAMDQLLTFRVDPLTDMFAEEIVRKRYGLQAVQQETYLTIDTGRIKHVDLLSVSTAIDKLISSGAFCVNDIRKLCGQSIIDESWARKHFITKNYTDIESILKALEEGEM